MLFMRMTLFSAFCYPPRMAGPDNLCAVILAAGESSRMGRDKALLPWPPDDPVAGQTMLSAGILALRPLVHAVIVVAGRNAANLFPVAAACGASLARNPVPERGQFSSMQVGLSAALASGCDAALVTPVDCPPVSARTLELLCASFAQALARGKWAVAPESHGRHGHPLVAGRELIDAFLAAAASSSAREVKHAHEKMIEYIPVSEPLLGIDLNTPEQYAALSGIAGKGG